ncbi:MAG: bifunctional phosphopantothenoylcysteine decarboxylase/phosphopantothenate--cysteine ligase CoaBC [Chitinophagales bacterium]
MKNKKIILGVCGSIAAYKTAILTRLLVKQNVEVKVVMTKSATEFISPLTLATLSKNPVMTDFVKKEGGLWNNHVDLGLWADAMIIAPASANTLGKMAHALSDNLLVATYLSARCPVFIAPAMDLDMWLHLATQRNIKLLEEAENKIIPVGNGELASGLRGAGRLAEPEDIVAYLNDFFAEKETAKNGVYKHLANKKVLITAGPTHEPIDPVRFIGNRSSGKMGIAIAEAALKQGANVTMVLGPTDLRPTSADIKVISVETAEQMFQATTKHFSDSDIAILAAAVSDYTPVQASDVKIKKNDGNMFLELKKTKDILAYLGTKKQKKQLLVGFALETNNELANANKKLKKKNLDFIVLNSLQDKGAGFKHNTNKITILDKYNNMREYELKSKTAVAGDIIEKIVSLLSKTVLETETVETY